jgi:hypothetical protein
MSADAMSVLDDVGIGGSLDRFVEGFFGAAGSITNPPARREVMKRVRQVEETLSLWRNQPQNFTKTLGVVKRSRLFALEPMELSEAEVKELDEIRARPSRAQGMTFRRVPVE